MRARHRRLQRDARRQRINQILIGLFFIVIMVGSIWGFSLSNAPDHEFAKKKFSFNGKEFEVPVGDTTLLVHGVPTSAAPGKIVLQNVFNQFVTVTMDDDVGPLLDGASYIATTFDPTTPPSGLQVIDLIRYGLTQAPNYFDGVLEPSERYPALQQVTCANAQPDYPVIQFLFGNTTLAARMTRDGNCITITGDAQGLLAAKDVLLLRAYKVLPLNA